MLASQFNDTLKELHSTKQSRKSARSYFEFPPSPPRKRPAPFTPPRVGWDLVSATQEDDYFDCDGDSLASQSSHTPRKRLIAKWHLVDVKLKSECTKDEAFAAFCDIVVDELVIDGSSDDIALRKDDLGLFRRAHVSFYLNYL